MLQCIMVCCSVLQCAAAHSSVLQHRQRQVVRAARGAVECVLQRVAACCTCCCLSSVLQYSHCDAVCCNVLQRVAVYCRLNSCSICNTKLHIVNCVLQRVAACCSALRRVAACPVSCSIRQVTHAELRVLQKRPTQAYRGNKY